jgi:hypothetical protein
MTDLMEHGQLFIGGEWVDPLGAGVIEVVSPHTEQAIGRVPHASRGTLTGRSPSRGGRSTRGSGRGRRWPSGSPW